MSPKKNPSVAAFESEELPDPASDAPLLEVTDLRVSFPSEDGRVNAVRGVNLTVGRGEVLALVGESGSGKSVTSTAVMGLLDESAQISGSVRLHGTELLGRDDDYMSKIRGTQVSMVFQDPLSALTPVYTVGAQIVEALQIHNPKMDRRRAWDRAVELLELVGIPNPEVRARAYPHEFSGGMRQRAVIAIAIANDPNLIIADEPTTALDVTIQAQILDVLRTAQKETGAGVVAMAALVGSMAGSFVTLTKKNSNYSDLVGKMGAGGDVTEKIVSIFSIIVGILVMCEAVSAMALRTLPSSCGSSCASASSAVWRRSSIPLASPCQRALASQSRAWRPVGKFSVSSIKQRSASSVSPVSVRMRARMLTEVTRLASNAAGFPSARPR